MLADKLNLVKKNIEEACDTAGRSPQEVNTIRCHQMYSGT